MDFQHEVDLFAPKKKKKKQVEQLLLLSPLELNTTSSTEIEERENQNISDNSVLYISNLVIGFTEADYRSAYNFTSIKDQTGNQKQRISALGEQETDPITIESQGCFLKEKGFTETVIDIMTPSQRSIRSKTKNAAI
ncbi:hypothetical protein AYI68_g6436 [Smittium mucronatum]|uniref:Uncharacterized protein n=1 Tax=Smittium mucronatum TaxID=133383 RepID=A0A1R0GRG5_9FUNG|nr:hypothetical protein AYI68_g6436 [Smittium mucronatum]